MCYSYILLRWRQDMLDYGKSFQDTYFRKNLILIDSDLLCFTNSFSKNCFNKKFNMRNRQFCPKRRPREANVFYVLTLDSVWGMSVNFNCLFLIFTPARKLLSPVNPSLLIRWSPKHQALVIKMFIMFIKTIRCKFCWLNISLILNENYSHRYN